MRLLLLLCAATLWMASPASADPFSINLLTSTHTVKLNSSWVGDTLPPVTRTTTDTQPVSDAFLVPGEWSDVQGGIASADLFEVSTWTEDASCCEAGTLRSVSASATTALTFMPLASGTALIDVTFLANSPWSASNVSLVDLTTSTTLWSLGWEFYFGWPTALTLIDAPTTIATQLDASHAYQLTLFGRTQASDDGQRLTTRVSGLEAVPEPSTLLLVGLGAGAAAIRSRRRRRP